MQARTREGRESSPEKEIFYGWYIVGACFVICFVLWGISVNAFTVYVKPLEADLGWSRKAISAAISLAAVSMALAAPFIGRLIDRLGVRRMMVGGTLIVGGAMMLLRWMHSLPYYYAMFIIAGVGQAAATMIPISVVVANWFTVKRGLAMGIAMSGTGVGAMVMVPICTWVVTQWGWRTSFFAMGVLIIVVAVPVIVFFIHTKPSAMGLRADGSVTGGAPQTVAAVAGLTVAQALRTRTFWLIAVMMFIFDHVVMGVSVHTMAYLTDLGYAAANASLIVAIASVMTIGGKLGVGVAADRWGLRWAVVITAVLVIGGLMLLMLARSPTLALAFALVYGFAIGAPMVFNPTLVSGYLGLAHFGAIFGSLSLASTLGAALGPLVSGAIYDATKSYVPAYVYFVVLVVVAALCGFNARPEVQGIKEGC